MSGYNDRFEIVFKCNLGGVSDMLNLCMDHIEDYKSICPIDPITQSKIKWVITELLTNAIKHSGVEECYLKIDLNEDQLLFEKTDYGKPLAIVEFQSGKQISWPLRVPLPLDIQIYHSGSESLWARVTDENEAAFFVKELDHVAMPALLNDTSEHFGLLILTKASDDFNYHYEPASGINRFRSTFKLQTV